MYQIFFNDLPIYDPRAGELGLVIRNPECRLAVGEAGALNFTIDPDHPYAADLTKMKGVLELRADGMPIYKGRIRKDTQDFALSRNIETEGLLACLNDSLFPPFNFPDDYLEDAAYQAAAENGNVIRFFLELLLAEHNGQVGPEQQLQLGDVTVTDPNNYLSRASSEYLTSMEVLRQKVTEPLGGYLLVDYSSDIPTLNYYDDLPLTNTQVVEFGENLLNLESILDAADIYTAILPVGSEGLTIGSMPDGELTPGYFKEGEIIYSSAVEERYGGMRITRKVDWKDVTIASNLQSKALAKLSMEGVTLAQTLTVTAADLSGGMDSLDDSGRFVVGRYVELRSTPHGFSAAYPLTELEPDLMNPGNTSITMGATIKAASDIAHGNQSAQREQLDQLRNILNQQQADIAEAAQVTQTQITSAIQTSEGFTLEALKEYVRTSSLEEYKTTVSSQFIQTANSIELDFEERDSRIEVVEGDLKQTNSDLEKHFDFGIDGLTIKSGPNKMTLTLDNDMIIFRKNGQQFGWWDGVDFHTGNIVIEVNERAQFGNFAYIPRSNGSLSFLKVSE